ALTLYRKTGNKIGEANALYDIGEVYRESGEPQKALEFYNQALILYRETGNKQFEANILYNIGLVYRNIGPPQKALEFYTQALAIYRAIGNKQDESDTLNGIGNVYKNTGEPQKALEFYNLALKLYRETGDKSGKADTLNNIGLVYSNTDQLSKALEFYNQALMLYREAGNKKDEAKTLNRIGNVYSDTGQPQKALEFFNQALTLYRAVGDKGGEADTLSNLTIIEKKLKKTDQAEAHYAQAVALYETLRENLGGFSESKSAFLGSIIGTYYDYLNLLMDQGKIITAFEIAQKTKARSLLDLMASGRVDLNAELTPEEKQQEQALRQKANFLNAQMINEGVQNKVGAKKRFAALKEDLKKTEDKLQTLTDTLYARHPSLAQKRVAKTATLEDMAKLLPPDTALLDYIVVSQEKLALFVIVQGKVKAFTLPFTYKSLVTKASLFRAACTDPRKDYKQAARELYKLLVSPAAKHLMGIKRLVICPDGALWDIPFQALLSGGQFLTQRFELAYAYSATGVQAALTQKAQRRKPSQMLLALANPDFGSSKRFGDLDDLPGQRPIIGPDRPIIGPDRGPSSQMDRILTRGKTIAALPGTQREADVLKEHFPSAMILTDKNAQESIAKAESGKYRYLHFATHGFFNDASPLLSSLVLAQPSTGSKDDGFLTAREIFDMDLSAELVVLSACNTGRGVQRTGDGVIGMTWALFVAGCSTQVVSQWSVNDASTATLMRSFYGNLVTRKLSKGAALRQASLSLMQDPKHSHPYYWAPFVLMGDWR
ncbi:CHAT domain-containing protein, partial [Armatimonas sp.]|uniref:CHAT domain-containing protein n=1 Tax=Armatimonas sp. TaxID=1872638 RepID=UPI003752A667